MPDKKGKVCLFQGCSPGRDSFSGNSFGPAYHTNGWTYSLSGQTVESSRADSHTDSMQTGACTRRSNRTENMTSKFVALWQSIFCQFSRNMSPFPSCDLHQETDISAHEEQYLLVQRWTKLALAVKRGYLKPSQYRNNIYCNQMSAVCFNVNCILKQIRKGPVVLKGQFQDTCWIPGRLPNLWRNLTQSCFPFVDLQVDFQCLSWLRICFVPKANLFQIVAACSFESEKLSGLWIWNSGNLQLRYIFKSYNHL